MIKTLVLSVLIIAISIGVIRHKAHLSEDGKVLFISIFTTIPGCGNKASTVLLIRIKKHVRRTGHINNRLKTKKQIKGNEQEKHS